MTGDKEEKLVLAIGGPTASGKSGLALSIAEEFHGVIVNFDSMQVYEGLPILTAQPSPEELEIVPHLLYSILDPKEVYSAALWRDRAIEEINKIHNDRKIPILVGGSGFYLRSLLKGLSPIPDIPLDVRLNLSKKQSDIGIKNFYKEFSKLDPTTAKNLDPFNSQRIIRAWEVLEFTGKGLSEWHEEPLIKPPPNFLFRNIIIIPEREKLYERCNLRFGEMVSSGAIEEVKKFREENDTIVPLYKALGYNHLCNYIDGLITIEDAIEKSSATTRSYAKRQVTWFKNQIKADFLLKDPKKEKNDILDWINKKCL